MQNTISEMEHEKTNEISQLQKKMDSLKQQIDMQGQQYEEALRRAENDKQQALLLGRRIRCGRARTKDRMEINCSVFFSSSRSERDAGEDG